MKLTMAAMAANLVSLACVLGGLHLAIIGKEGWGWFLFVGVLCAGSVKLRD